MDNLESLINSHKLVIFCDSSSDKFKQTKEILNKYPLKDLAVIRINKNENKCLTESLNRVYESEVIINIIKPTLD